MVWRQKPFRPDIENPILREDINQTFRLEAHAATSWLTGKMKWMFGRDCEILDEPSPTIANAFAIASFQLVEKRTGIKAKIYGALHDFVRREETRIVLRNGLFYGEDGDEMIATQIVLSRIRRLPYEHRSLAVNLTHDKSIHDVAAVPHEAMSKLVTLMSDEGWYSRDNRRLNKIRTRSGILQKLFG